MDISPSRVLAEAVKYKDWAPLAALILTALAYQIGWLLDYGTYLFFYYVPLWMPGWVRWLLLGNTQAEPAGRKLLPLGRTIKRKYIGDTEFWLVYMAVHQKASPAASASLQTDLSLIRLSRTGVVNFAATGVALLLSTRSWTLALSCLVIAAMSLYLLARRWDIYYRKTRACWDQLTS